MVSYEPPSTINHANAIIVVVVVVVVVVFVVVGSDQKFSSIYAILVSMSVAPLSMGLYVYHNKFYAILRNSTEFLYVCRSTVYGLVCVSQIIRNYTQLYEIIRNYTQFLYVCRPPVYGLVCV